MKIEDNNSTKHIAISEKTRDRIFQFIGKYPAERGGILGADSDGVIRHFAPDPTARCTGGAYDPDIEQMNRQIRQWKTENIRFAGFVHSHPAGFKRLSGPDEDYATKILASFKSLDRLCLPLAMTIPDCGQFELLPFVAIPDAKNRRQVSFEPAELAIEAESAAPARANSTTTVHVRLDDCTTSPAKDKSTTTVAKQPEEAASQAANANKADAAALTTRRYYGDFPSAWIETDLRKRGQNAKDRVEPLERLRELQQYDIARQQSERHFERVNTAVNVRLLDGARLCGSGYEGGRGGLPVLTSYADGFRKTSLERMANPRRQPSEPWSH